MEMEKKESEEQPTQALPKTILRTSLRALNSAHALSHAWVQRRLGRRRDWSYRASAIRAPLGARRTWAK